MTDDEVLKDRDPEDPLILVITARIFRKGLTLTRANYTIITKITFAKQAKD